MRMTQKRIAQQNENKIIDDFMDTLPPWLSPRKTYPLRYCSARVLECTYENTGEVYYVLCSYNTCVAAVCAGVGYDFLRKVYGYTSTSAHHIAKFFSDYHATERHRYYPI